MSKADQGDFSDRYNIIPRTLIFIMKDEAVLLIKGAPSKRLWANLYNGIGGHIDRAEDALSAARRELYEETGLKDVALNLVGVVMVDVGEQQGIGLFVFRGKYTRGKLRSSPEGKLEWVLIDQLNAYPLVEDLQTLLPKVLQMQPGDSPFSAQYVYDDQDQLRITFGS